MLFSSAAQSNLHFEYQVSIRLFDERLVMLLQADVQKIKRRCVDEIGIRTQDISRYNCAIRDWLKSCAFNHSATSSRNRNGSAWGLMTSLTKWGRPAAAPGTPLCSGDAGWNRYLRSLLRQSVGTIWVMQNKRENHERKRVGTYAPRGFMNPPPPLHLVGLGLVSALPHFLGAGVNDLTFHRAIEILGAYCSLWNDRILGRGQREKQI